MRLPLIDGQGNFGSPGNDPAAAMRYTEARLDPLAMHMLADIEEDTVDFSDNYDGRTQEPDVLPARIPNLLVNGGNGIAVGMATNIPPHNLREVADGVVYLLDNPAVDDETLLEELIKLIKGPDFPTRGLIMGTNAIADAYRTGRGSIRMRSVVSVEEDAKGRTSLVVTELPYQVNPDNLIESIATMHRDGKISGVSDIADESNSRRGMRIVITLKRDAIPKVVLNNLYKHTQLQTTFGVNMLALVEGVPRTLRIDQVVRHYVKHQIEVIVRRTRYRLRKAEERRAVAAESERERFRVELAQVNELVEGARRNAERDGARIEWLRETVARLEERAAGAEHRAGELTTRNAELEAQNSALVQRAVRKYRTVVERVAPRGTSRRDVYEIALGREPGSARPAVQQETGPIAVPRSDEPVVSVIVPVHGKWPYTRQCLRFLAGHLVSVPFEVVVVDDASPDDSAAKLAACDGVRLVRAERNLGFIGACNLGAEHARGRNLFFLNNDAEVTESWLDTLMSTMDSNERIGLVGAKLVYPDGRLQECGAVVWSDGTGWNLGRGGDPDAAEYNDVRDVDYCSGAAILVRAGVFREVGGFDGRFAPAYYEDTDLAFAVRAAGYRTVVQPKAVVVHHEGISNGTDASTGVKRHQELNRQVFVDKWADALADHLEAHLDVEAIIEIARRRPCPRT